MSVGRPRAAGVPTAEEIASFRAHPRFPEAFTASIGDLVAFHRNNRVVSQVLNDRGRVVFGVLALYLHFSKDTDFTPSAMKALCSETGLCSPGRATAMLSLMRFAGYIASAPHALDRRSHVLVPSPSLLADHRRRLRGELVALAVVAPEGQVALERLDDQDFIAEMARVFGETFRAGLRMLNYAPELFPLADRNAGMVTLMSLLLAREPGDGIPPTRPVTVSISDLSKRFGVSRPHILKLLRDAEAAGFIRLDSAESQRIAVLPSLSEGLQNFVAAVLLTLVHCVRTSLDRLGAAPRSSGLRHG
jgi:DNA-binding MarR family transcriptional regulator